MQTLSPLAAQILPMLTTPLTLDAVRELFADPIDAGEVESALDELTPHLVTCDEHKGVPYFYRRDTEAERTRAATWNAASRAASREYSLAIAAATRDYDAAIVAADAERDASDPMAAIRARVSS